MKPLKKTNLYIVKKWVEASSIKEAMHKEKNFVPDEVMLDVMDYHLRESNQIGFK